MTKKQGKKVGGIEDIGDQMDILDDLFDEVDVAYLASDSLQELQAGMIDKMKDIYIKQDLNGVESLTESASDQKFKDAILTKRNLKMARRMDSLARQRSSFFAIGVAHLPGDTGVINLLKKGGFTVEPVFSSKKIALQNYSYKTIEMPWVKFAHNLHLYEVEVPGVLQSLDVMKDVMDMKLYYDVTTGKAYYTAVINSVADPDKKDSLFAVIINRMAPNNRTLISQKNIIKQDFEGRDVLLKAGEDQVLNINVYLADGYAYMAMILCKKSEVNDNDAKRFFESFQMTPASSVSMPYMLYNDTAMAFSIMFPTQPLVNENTGTEDGTGGLKVLSATDFSSGNSYAVTIRNTKPGNYIANDSIYLNEIKSSVIKSMKDDTVVRRLTFKGYPALQVNGSAKTDNGYYRTLTVLRGNRSYFIIAQSKITTDAIALADHFFDSFSLSNYSTSNWKTSSARDSSFATWLPEPDISAVKGRASADSINALRRNGELDSDEKDKVKNDFIFYDNSTGTSYNVQRERFSDYYFSKDDSTFFTEAGLAFKAKGDSMVSFKLLRFENDNAADIQIESPSSSIVKRFRFILHNDTLYKVFTYTPRRLADNENTQRFFDRFTITSTALSTTLFTNKTARLVADLSSADSTSFEKATEYLYEAKLNKEDLPAFYPLLIKPLKDFAETTANTNNRLIDAVAEIADSTTVSYIFEHYDKLKDEQLNLQYPLLKLLVEMNQSYATETAVKLLDSGNTPKGDVSVFAAALSGNLTVAKTLYPKIVSLTQDTLAALEYAQVIKRLVDSSYIANEMVLPYLKHLIAAADGEKKKIKSGENEFDYNIFNALDLFGVLNSPLTNSQLQEYTRVPNLAITFNAVSWLIKNKQQLPLGAINKLASSPSYRAEMYDTLSKVNKINLFPVAWRSQKLFAESYIFNVATEGDEYPSGVKYVLEKVVTYRGQKQKFYLFKVTFGEGEDVTNSLGIAGPFKIDNSSVWSSNEATGIFSKEGFSTKQINHQFEEYLASVLQEME